MLHMYTTEKMLKILLCLLGILLCPTDQVPVGQSFSLLLYPAVSVLGPYRPQGVLIPMATSEQNVQQQSSLQSDHSSISPDGVFKPLSAFLHSVIYSVPGPAPDPVSLPPESLALQGQGDSDSSEEEQTAQVIYIIPINVDSSNMGMIDGMEPNLDPGHLHVPTTTTPGTVTPAVHAEAQGQLGVTVVPEMSTERHSGKTETLKKTETQKKNATRAVY